jgi:hypothetical protein
MAISVLPFQHLQSLEYSLENCPLKKIDGAKLKPAFGWFLIMGIYIITKRELILK